MNVLKTLTFFAFCLSVQLFAQKGTIRGTVYDQELGDPLYGVSVVIVGTTNGAVTDFDGNFEIKAEPGVYDVRASFVSYSPVTITDVKVEAGQVTLLDNIKLSEAVQELEGVTVSAEAIRNTESALLTVKKKSPNVIDGISAQAFRKIGDSDAASAMKRVTGVTVEGGKYVYVRGLGDRYTKTILNGVDIPGLDPNRNSLQMDIFPTNVIKNIMVSKSFTADLPADFTGGIVNIETKDFPEEKVFRISGSLGYNPAMHLNSNYLSYAGGGTDFLAFDDGTRAIPTGRATDIPQFASVVAASEGSPARQRYIDILNDFNPVLGASPQTSFMDYNFGVSLGNQFRRNGRKIGYNVALSYKNSTDFYQGAENNFFGKADDVNTFDLEGRELQVGDFGVNNVLIGGLAGVAMKTEKAKFKVNLLHLQNGESKAGIYDYMGADQGANFEAIQHNLEYSQRSLSNILISGEHHNEDGDWELEWKVSPTRSGIEDPDIRFTRIRTDGSNLTIGTESGIPERIWRYLEEYNMVGKIDATKTFEWMDAEAKLKFGASHTYKQRDYEIQNFFIRTRSLDVNSTDPNELLQDENLWPNNSNGAIYEPNFIPVNPNLFDANVNNTGAYASMQASPVEGIKTIIGLRAEYYLQHYTGAAQGGISYENEEVLNSLDLFPSVNFIYSVTDNQNLRFSFSRTIARPSFKEASIATILDPISGRTFIGGFYPDVDVVTGAQIWDGNLTETRINNFDLRWEIFQERAQTISVSAFYKSFDDPIEIVQYLQATNSFQPRNVGDGMVIGGELELRQNLAFISRSLEAFSLNTNITVTESQIQITPNELQSRRSTARVGQTVGPTRDMAGQAPYIVNAGFSYNSSTRKNPFEAGVFYNVQGPTLQFVGIADRPDVYSVPFHSLNFNANYSFGPEQRINAGVKVSNLLNDDKENVFRAFNAQDQLFSSLSPGTTFSLRFAYTF